VEKLRQRNDLVAGLLALVHLGIAVLYNVKWITNPRCWDCLMAAIPRATLQHHLWESIWFMHAQPPLYNLYGGLMFRFFDSQAYRVMEVIQVALGAAITGMAFILAIDLLKNRRLAFIGTLIFVALNPSLFVYESFAFYTIYGAFLITGSAFAVHLFFVRQQPRYLYALVVCTNLLVMVRSLYHLVFLAAVCLLAALLAQQRWRRVLAVSLAVSSLSFGWYMKNWIQYDFFGASSWAGYNLWTNVRQRYTQAELQERAAKGELHRVVVDHGLLGKPDVYAPYGYQDSSPVESLSEMNFQNIVYVEVGKTYLHDALYLMADDPLHYVGNMVDTFAIYVQPSYDLKPNQIKWVQKITLQIDAHTSIYRDVIYGRGLFRRIDHAIGIDFGSILFFLLPVSVSYYVGRGRLRENPVTFYIAFLILYTTLISCMVEYGENNRFKTPIEPLLWLFIVAMGQRIIRGLRR